MNQVRWLRVVVAALLVEIGLVATTVPFFLVLGERVFATAVPVACIVVPFVVAWLATRKLPSAQLLNGLLIDIVATAMYFVLVVATGSNAEARRGLRRADVRRRQRVAHRQRRRGRIRCEPRRGRGDPSSSQALPIGNEPRAAQSRTK